MPCQILVVNDDPSLIAVFTDLLQDEGYQATGLRYPDASLDTIAHLAPDLIILDLMVGGEAQGWAMLNKLRLHQPTAATPVLVCLYFPTPQIIADPQLRRQHVSVVPMPPNIDELLNTIAQALSKTEPAPPST